MDSVTSFIEEWSVFLSQISLSKSNVLLLGDMNFHLDNPTSSHTRNFLLSLESHDLHQHICSPTHQCGNTLDVLITRDTDTPVCDTEVVDISLCNDDGHVINDHFPITFSLNLHRPNHHSKVISYKNHKNMNSD